MATFVDDGKGRVSTGDGFVGASRGIKAPDVKASVKGGSFIGDAGKDIADLITMGANTTDKYFQNEMDVTIEDVQANVAENYGVNAAVDIMEKPDGTPEMDRAVTKISRMKTAMEQGLLPKSTYDAQVLAMTKSARASYGRGHRAIFDRKLEDATGVSQNSLRKNLMSELSDLSTDASDRSKEWNRALQSNGEFLPPSDVALMQSDYAAFKAKYPSAESLTVAATPMRSQYQRLQNTQKVLDVNKAEKNLSVEQLETTVGNGVSSIINGVLFQTAGSLPGGQDFIKLVETNVKNPNPENTKQLQAMIPQLRAKYMNDITQYVMSNTAGTSMTVESKQKLIEQSAKTFDLFVSPATENNYGGLFLLKNMYEANKSGAELEFSNTELGQMLLAYQAAGPYIANSAFESLRNINPELFVKTTKAMLAGKHPKDIFTETTYNTQDSFAVHSSYLSGIKKAAGEGNAQAAQELTTKMFGQGTEDYISRFSKPEARTRLWQSFVDPEFQKALKSGSGITYETFGNYVQKEFFNTARKDLGALDDLQQGQTRAIYAYNAEMGRFVVSMPDPVSNKGNAGYNGAVAAARPYVDALNAGLTVVDPVLDHKKIDKNAYMQNLSSVTGGKKIPGMMKAGVLSAEEIAATDLEQGNQVSADAGTRVEMKEMMDLYNKTEDPALKKLLKDEIFNLSTGTESTEPAQVKRNGQSNLGGPVDVTKVAQSPAATEIIDLLTGAPSFIEALKSGDAATIAAAVASVIPFPGAKVGKAGKAIEKVVEKAGEVIEPITLEAKRIAKELEQKPVRDAQALKDMEASGNLTRQSFERMDNLSFDDMMKYEGELRSGASNRKVTLPKAGSSKKDWSDTDKLGVKSLKDKLDRLLVASSEGGNNAEEIAKISRYLRKLDLEVVK